MGPGWLPVAWGRAVYLQGTVTNPFPEEEEGGWKRKRPNRSRPKGLMGFASTASWELSQLAAPLIMPPPHHCSPRSSVSMLVQEG
eukprot:1222108-Pyramimonas_sp.AAC.1